MEHWKDVEKQGEVKAQMVWRCARTNNCAAMIPLNLLDPADRLQDRTIGKTVVQVSGSIPAVNYIKLPKARSGLNLSGRFLYMQASADQHAGCHACNMVCCCQHVTYVMC